MIVYKIMNLIAEFLCNSKMEEDEENVFLHIEKSELLKVTGTARVEAVVPRISKKYLNKQLSIQKQMLQFQMW